ncbi:hypothetical protein DH2020_013250 [Rehmannia glutinosa]|uniref:PWWP domain-containing protein n=1 Tax=Rehmannia glutinosa TaxID=99300 RepID=A0ABR0X345_REHGL
MGSSGEDPNKAIDVSAGGLVWVRRRNGSWWPGKILGPDELPEGSVPTPRSGTPVKLLGRDDASVDWYNLEKSKRVKAFHCGEYDHCIEKVKASASHLSKKAPKYARRDDAILHALELENASLGKNHPDLSATPDTQHMDHHHVDESPSASYPSEENKDFDENSNSSEDGSDLAQEVYQSVVSVEELDRLGSVKEEHKQKIAPNDSEEEGAEGSKRMRGLEDLGMNVSSPLKRKRSQIAHNQELLKRKNRRRTLTKVLECTTVVSIPVGEQLSSPTGSSMLVVSDSKISGLESDESKKNDVIVANNNSNSNGVSCETGMLLYASRHDSDATQKCKQKGNESLERLFDVPLVAEKKGSAGLSLILSDASQQAQVGAGTQSSQSSHVETVSLGNEENNESGSTSSGTGNVHFSPSTEKGTSEWRLKGKRNSRSRKVDILDDTDTYMANVDREIFSGGSSQIVGPNHLKSKPITEVEEFRGWSWNAPQKPLGSTADFLVPQRSLPYRQSRFTVNPKYDSSDFSLQHHIPGSGLYDVPLEVKTTYRTQHVPYISLMSKLTGRPIVGHPLAIGKLRDGFCNKLIRMSECYNSSSELDYNLSKHVVSSFEHAGMVRKRKPRGRPPNKRHAKSRKNGPLSKKTRKLSLLTGSHRLSRDEKKPLVEKLKGPSIACVPLNVVFSRINAALSGSVRPAPRSIATSGM